MVRDQAWPSHPLPRYQADEENSNKPQRSCELDDNEENLPFPQKLRNASVLSHYVLPKVPKNDGRGDPAKNLNNYKTHMNLRSVIPRVKCKAFHLTLCGVAKIWYNRIPLGSIKRWLEFKNTFLKRFIVSKEGEAHIQRLQDMRQQPG